MGGFWGEDDYATVAVLLAPRGTMVGDFRFDDPLKKLFDAIGTGKYVSVDLSDCICEYPSTPPNVIPDRYAPFNDLPGIGRPVVDRGGTIHIVTKYPAGGSSTRTENKDIVGGYMVGITLPESIKETGMAFMGGNRSLVSVNFPQPLQKIGDGAFGGTAITSAVFSGGNVTEIGNSAFSGCSSIGLIDFCGSPLRKIGGHAFGSTAITEFTLPEGIESFGDFVFEGCASLETVNLPADMTAIPDGTFSNTYSLKTINLDRITSIGDSAFASSGLKTINLDNITKIGAKAFESSTRSYSHYYFSGYCHGPGLGRH
jgi:hypothetical protein